MNGKRMINSEIIFADAVADLSDKAFRLYINLMLYADDDGFVDKLKFAKMITGAEESELNELLDAYLITKIKGDKVLVLDWLIHNNIKKTAYHNLAPTEVRTSIRVETNGRYTLDTNANDAMTIDEFRAWKASRKTK